MATKQDHPLLDRPLYLFDLPQEILQTLELRADLNASLPVTQEDREPRPLQTNGQHGARDDTPEGSPASATSCAMCGLAFANLQEQKEHVRSDLHGYNLKQKIRGKQAVDEKEFERLVGELDESLSGSDSSSYSDSSDDDTDAGVTQRKDTTLTALLKKQASLADNSFEESVSKKRKRGSGKPPLLWFTSPKLPTNTSLGVYRAIFSPKEQVADSTTLIQTLQRKQLSPKSSKKQSNEASHGDDAGGVPLPNTLQHKPLDGPHYFLCMIGGGHFAAMIISLTPSITRKGGMEDRSATVVAHKTFHRYTTRRKQGGSQSANDNSKGNAHSAGSSLRRYNEVALTNDVRNLLNEWRPWLQTAELLFIRATGTTNRRTLFDRYEGQVLSSNDPRIRGFPFSTRRATQAELMRSFVELTRVKVTTIDELALARKAAEDAARAEQEASAPKPAASPKPSKPKPSKEEEEGLLHTSQLQSLIRRSKAPALISYITTNSIPPNFLFLPHDRPENYHAPTPLHLAASLNSSVCVSALLLKASANPAVRNLEEKTPYDIAGDRATRDAFRLARSELGEAARDWESGHVGPALTRAEVDARAKEEKKGAEAEKAAELKRREEEVARLRDEDKVREEQGRERKFGKGKTMSTAQPLSAQERREEEARGLTPEMRMRLERERRARAAEARMRG
ncbi:hypothetical protein K461DRAFT_323058 [Myriangium duriaei CBS 260.36]|uniref:VLRF1 domain-containing protein n=1 Tax=Myriangium duriaei CBS 260.36 TaxID=1168546 RepID=A0A9P4IZH5_9PEZI|nr:hypothetical protein K461DRAFT_323058 [Myriangium duriaei CBS 260.36]